MESVRSENRSAILTLVNDKGPISRKDIAEATGLTPASVTQITTQLIEEGLLRERGFSREASSGAGRKKILLDIDANSHYVCSVNIDPIITTIAICNLKGHLVKEDASENLIVTIGTDKSVGAEEYLKYVCEECTKLFKRLAPKERKKIECVSIGISGTISEDKTASVMAVGLWEKEVKITGVFSKALKLPVLLENDVDALAQAEIMFGTGRTRDNILLMFWGIGVGSAMIINEEVHRGRGGKTAEVGHCIVRRNGVACGCGRRGCLEAGISYKALSNIISFNPDELEQGYIKANNDQKEAIDKAIDLFGRTLVNVGSVVAPRRIILSGRMFKGKIIRDKIIEFCKSYDSNYDEKRVIYTTLADRESYIGPVGVFAKSRLV